LKKALSGQACGQEEEREEEQVFHKFSQFQLYGQRFTHPGARSRDYFLLNYCCKKTIFCNKHLLFFTSVRRELPAGHFLRFPAGTKTNPVFAPAGKFPAFAYCFTTFRVNCPLPVST
jgi:hypothetical protein